MATVMTSLTIERAINTPVDRVGIRQMDKVAGDCLPCHHYIPLLL